MLLMKADFSSHRGINPPIGHIIAVGDQMPIPNGWVPLMGQHISELSQWPALLHYMERNKIEYLPTGEPFPIERSTRQPKE